VEDNPLRDLLLSEAIELRWLLRDIRSRRWALAPLDASRVERLRDMGLIEFEGSDPVLTKAGSKLIERT
jgi:hypothetical protein